MERLKPIARLAALVGLVLALLAGLAGPGCTSRTLPLPPPTIDEVSSPDPEGMVVVRGLAQENASVGVLNNTTGEGVIVTPGESGCARSCSYEATLPAEVGELIRAWQFFETEPAAEQEVPQPSP